MLKYYLFLLFFHFSIIVFFAQPPDAKAQVKPEEKLNFINLYPAVEALTGQDITKEPNLDDWKPELFMDLYEDVTLKDRFTVRMAFAYDSDHLYIAAQYRDDSPMVNKINPKLEAFSGWNGDAFQIRFVADSSVTQPVDGHIKNTKKVVHLTMWYFAQWKMSAVDVRYGMDYKENKLLTLEESGLYFATVEGGYIMKAKIPWKSMGVEKPPNPGDKWVMTLQPLWGNERGVLVHHFYECITRGAFQFEGTEGWGEGRFLTLGEVEPAIAEQKMWAQKRADREKRQVVAKSATGKGNTQTLSQLMTTTEEGKVSFQYTLPENGFISMGIYNEEGKMVKLLLTREEREAGEHTETWDYLDAKGQKVAPGKYQARLLTHPGIKPRYVTSVMNSGTPSWRTADGKGGWGGDHGNPISIAVDGKGHKFLLWNGNEAGDALICLNEKDQKQWGVGGMMGGYAVCTDGKLVYLATREGNKKDVLYCYNIENGERAEFENKKSSWMVSLLKDEKNTENITGIACDETALYLAVFTKDKILAIEKKTGKPFGSFNVKAPRGLGIDSKSQTLYTTSGEKLMAIDLGKSQTPRTLATALIKPSGVCVDAEGTVYVSQRGTSMTVAKFNASGAPLGKIGFAGGRKLVGKYDPRAMSNPVGMAVDEKGRLWVAEEEYCPKRFSLWEARTGGYLKEFMGGTAYSARMTADPNNPENVYLHYTRFIVNYETGEVRPDAVVFRPGSRERSLSGLQGYGFMGQNFEFASMGGKSYAHDGFGGIYRVEAGELKPVAYFGFSLPGWGVPVKMPVSWTDKNGDGMVNSKELRVLDRGYHPQPMNAFGSGFFNGGVFLMGRKLFRPTKVEGTGVPVYPEPDVAPDFTLFGNAGEMAKYSNRVDTCPSEKANFEEFYTLASLPSPDGARVGGGEEGLYKFRKDGKVIWRYPRIALEFGLSKGLSKPGDLFGVQRFIGQVQMPDESGGEIIGVGCSRGYFGFVNEDGLFVDQVCRDLGSAPTPNFDVIQATNFGGYFFRHPKTGKVYLFCGDTDGRILELENWDKIRRLKVDFVLEEPSKPPGKEPEKTDNKGLSQDRNWGSMRRPWKTS
ncbi:MAG: FlgD immunoglobulin-like domain containing protein [Verrucomicrobiae bacterium]|nr:FlgD immunoglobulin-like domain containing protein [Verrucomicrobiae bacterium]